MSHNITSVEVLSGQLFMEASDIQQLLEMEADDAIYLPESCFLYEHERSVGVVDVTKEDFWWNGVSSGNSFREIFLKLIVPKMKGNADLAFIWEGGNSVEGLRIQDGTHKEMLVKMVLEEE